MSYRLLATCAVLFVVVQGSSWSASAQQRCPQMLAEVFGDQGSLVSFFREARSAKARLSEDIQVQAVLGRLEVTLDSKSSSPFSLRLASPAEVTSREIMDVLGSMELKGPASQVTHEWPPQKPQVRHVFDREGKEHVVVLSPLRKGWRDVDGRFTHMVFHDYLVDRSQGQATYVGRAFQQVEPEAYWQSARYDYNFTPDFHVDRAGELSLRMHRDRPVLPSTLFHTPDGKRAVPGADSIFRTISHGSVEVKEPAVRLSLEKGKFSGLGLIQPKDLKSWNETWVRPDAISSGRRTSITDEVEAEVVHLVANRSGVERPVVAVRLVPKEGYQIQNQDIFEFFKRLALPPEANSLKFYQAHLREFGVLKNGDLMILDGAPF